MVVSGSVLFRAQFVVCDGSHVKQWLTGAKGSQSCYIMYLAHCRFNKMTEIVQTTMKNIALISKLYCIFGKSALNRLFFLMVKLRISK